MIILDSTSIVRGDWRLARPDIRALVATASEKGVKVAIPEVVIREAVRNMRDELSKRAKSADSLLRQYAKLSKDRMPRPFLHDKVETDVKQYESALRKRCVELGINILEIPQVSHEKILERDLAVRKPFDRDGKGYRDTLIWHTVVEAAKSDGSVIFVTNNKSDFGGPGQVHADLKRDLDRAGLPTSSVLIKANLAETFAHLKDVQIGDATEHVGKTVREAFGDDTWLNLCQQLDAILVNDPLISNHMTEEAAMEWPGYDLGVVTHAGLGRITRATRLATGEVLVDAEYAMSGTVYDVDYEDKPHYTYYETSFDGKARFTVDAKGTVTSADVVDLTYTDIDDLEPETEWDISAIDDEMREREEAGDEMPREIVDGHAREAKRRKEARERALRQPAANPIIRKKKPEEPPPITEDELPDFSDFNP